MIRPTPSPLFIRIVFIRPLAGAPHQFLEAVETRVMALCL